MKPLPKPVPKGGLLVSTSRLSTLGAWPSLERLEEMGRVEEKVWKSALFIGKNPIPTQGHYPCQAGPQESPNLIVMRAC